MDGKLIGRGDRNLANDVWYDKKYVGVIIPDYKSRYGLEDSERRKVNEDLFSDFDSELNKIKLNQKDVKIDFDADCGMGLDFPVVALIVASILALPCAINSSIKLIKTIKDYVHKKREMSRDNGIPTIGQPIFDPRILEQYCYELLQKGNKDLMKDGGDFEHVITIDPSYKKKYYQYGVIYLIIFRSTLCTEAQLFPHWAIRITCTGDLIDINQILTEDQIPPHIYFDDELALQKATGKK